MPGNDTPSQSKDKSGAVRPLIVSDSRTVQDFCAPLRHLLFGFEAQDIHSSLVVPPNSEMESLLWPGVEVIEHPALKLPLFFRQNRNQLISRAEKFKPTVVHCLGTDKAHLAKTIGRTFDIPVVVTINSSRQGFLKQQILNTGFPAIIAPSEPIADSFKKRKPRMAALLRQVNMGTFVDETCACFSRLDRIPSIVMVSDFLKFSDIEPLLGAVRHLAVDGYEFLVVLMGQGPAENDIRKFVHSVGLIHTVNISPKIRPLRVVFRSADIFIQAYTAERFDSVMIEAAAAGSVIVTDRNNADNFLQSNTTSVFFDNNDELSIYSALQRLIDDKDWARSIASNAQNYLRTNNTVSAMVNKLLEIYKSAISEHKSLQ
ncbi:MAG: glycosyltransferase family 4 protein [Sedimentisphaerales bacterium]|nr:glycosyltransferase family 4 protein [Sedimentisphaerales bacterium]